MKNYKFLVSLLITAVIFFFIWMEYKAYQIRNVIADSFSWLSNDLSNPIEEKGTENINLIKIEKSIWEPVQLATMEIKIEKSEEQTILNKKYSTPQVARQWSKYVVIDINIKNITKNTFSDYFSDIAIEDNEWNNYLPTSAIMLIDDYIEWRELAPQIEEKWKLVYEVPENINSYSFKIWKSWTDEVYYIKLK